MRQWIKPPLGCLHPISEDQLTVLLLIQFPANAFWKATDQVFGTHYLCQSRLALALYGHACYEHFGGKPAHERFPLLLIYSLSLYLGSKPKQIGKHKK